MPERNNDTYFAAQSPSPPMVASTDPDVDGEPEIGVEPSFTVVAAGSDDDLGLEDRYEGEDDAPTQPATVVDLDPDSQTMPPEVEAFPEEQVDAVDLAPEAVSVPVVEELEPVEATPVAEEEEEEEDAPASPPAATEEEGVPVGPADHELDEDEDEDEDDDSDMLHQVLTDVVEAREPASGSSAVPPRVPGTPTSRPAGDEPVGPTHARTSSAAFSTVSALAPSEDSAVVGVTRDLLDDVVNDAASASASASASVSVSHAAANAEGENKKEQEEEEYGEDEYEAYEESGAEGTVRDVEGEEGGSKTATETETETFVLPPSATALRHVSTSDGTSNKRSTVLGSTEHRRTKTADMDRLARLATPRMITPKKKWSPKKDEFTPRRPRSIDELEAAILRAGGTLTPASPKRRMKVSTPLYKEGLYMSDSMMELEGKARTERVQARRLAEAQAGAVPKSSNLPVTVTVRKARFVGEDPASITASYRALVAESGVNELVTAARELRTAGGEASRTSLSSAPTARSSPPTKPSHPSSRYGPPPALGSTFLRTLSTGGGRPVTAGEQPQAPLLSPGPGSYNPVTVISTGKVGQVGRGAPLGFGKEANQFRFEQSGRTLDKILHAKCHSPGPIYKRANLDVLTSHYAEPTYTFNGHGRGGRFDYHAEKQHNMPHFNPGPGRYESGRDYKGGTTNDGRKNTVAKADTVRTHLKVHPVYVTRGHERERLGTNGLGPGVYETSTAYETNKVGANRTAVTMGAKAKTWIEKIEEKGSTAKGRFMSASMDRKGGRALGEGFRSIQRTGGAPTIPRGKLRERAYLEAPGLEHTGTVYKTEEHARTEMYGTQSPGPVYDPVPVKPRIPGASLKGGATDRFFHRSGYLGEGRLG